MKSLQLVVSLLVLLDIAAAAQQAPVAALTLDEAERAALANQPRIEAAALRAEAAGERARSERAALLPTAAFNTTGARVADAGSAIGAGGLATSGLASRFAYGVSLTQLVTDFGRTAALVASARALAAAQSQSAAYARAQVRLGVRAAFFEVLGAEAVLRSAQAALINRHLVVRQLSALAASQLRSNLDVHFAQVLESEAELAVVQAESLVAERRADLATAMGAEAPVTVPLAEAPESGPQLNGSVEEYLQEAHERRADLRAAEARQEAAGLLARSEARLGYPTLSALAVAGQIPLRDPGLHDNYAAAGFNLNVPLFTGGLYAARRAEAELEARARARDAQQLRLEINGQARRAWTRAEEAQKSLEVSVRLVAQSKESLRLAQARYDAGLGSIVELNEAQLNETAAEVRAADAQYALRGRRAELDFTIGLLN